MKKSLIAVIVIVACVLFWSKAIIEEVIQEVNMQMEVINLFTDTQIESAWNQIEL